MKGFCCLLPFLIGIIFFGSCTKDREFVAGNNVVVPDDTTPGIHPGCIVVNEFIAKGSPNLNEFNNPSDWMELYNVTNDTILMKAGKWFVTDSLGIPDKYELPEVLLNPKSFLLIWCDDSAKVLTQIHSNFALSANGEQVGIFYADSTGNFIQIDGYTFGPQQSSISLGRKPDGSANWVPFTTPTPGSTNN